MLKMLHKYAHILICEIPFCWWRPSDGEIPTCTTKIPMVLVRSVLVKLPRFFWFTMPGQTRTGSSGNPSALNEWIVQTRHLGIAIQRIARRSKHGHFGNHPQAQKKKSQSNRFFGGRFEVGIEHFPQLPSSFQPVPASVPPVNHDIPNPSIFHRFS